MAADAIPCFFVKHILRIYLAPGVLSPGTKEPGAGDRPSVMNFVCTGCPAGFKLKGFIKRIQIVS